MEVEVEMESSGGGNGYDFLEWVGPDTSALVFSRLADPADLANASSTSRSWRRFAIENGFSKSLCLRICPEAATFAHLEEIRKSAENEEAGSSTATELKNLEKQHRIYTYLSHSIVSQEACRDCIQRCIGASSTDNFPYESIENTLQSRDRVNHRPSYWSSGGEVDEGVPESLTYRLNSDLCVINEFKVQPFGAFFQDGNPIYSAKSVLMRLGYSKLSPVSETCLSDEEDEEQQLIAKDNYVWTYISPEFPMLQQNVLQSFKLPRPALCIGGVVRIELLGRVQRQDTDNLYYICVSHVQVIGRTLSPVLITNTSDPRGYTVLKYIPGAMCMCPDGTPQTDCRETLQLHAFMSRYRQMSQLNVLRALLGRAEYAEEEDGVSDEDLFQ